MRTDYSLHIIYSIAALIVFTILMYGCGDGLKKVQVFTEEGVLEKEYTIDQDSFMQGVLITYYSNGKDVFEKAEYLDDRLHGTRTLYYSSGQAEIVENYLQDILTDTLYMYYESGALKMKSYYNSGIHLGENTAYFENGVVKEVVQFKDNVEQGPFIEYYENGEIAWQGQYLNGDNEVGELKQYNEEGVLIKKMDCDSLGVCATVWTIEKGDIVPSYVRKSS